MYRNHNKKGFTMIEVTIAMGFVAALLISIVVVGNRLLILYNKGITMKDVNAVSRQVVRDIQDSVASGEYIRLKTSKPLLGVPTPPVVKKTLRGASDSSNPARYFNDPSGGGRLCTGSYSYAWNYPQAIQQYDSADPATFTLGTYPIQTLNSEPVRLVKTPDPTRSLCEYRDPGNKGGVLPTGGDYEYINVLSKGNGDLRLYSFDISLPTVNDFLDTPAFAGVESATTYYNISLTLGTGDGTEDVSAIGCNPGIIAGDEENSDGNDFAAQYCAMNKIDFVAITGLR